MYRLFAIPALAFAAAVLSVSVPASKAIAVSPIANCATYSGIPEGDGDKAGMVFIPGGSFVMGSDRERPEERFSHSVKVDGFWIDQHEVTNAEFAKFVEATGYKTLAERGIDPKTHPGMEALSEPGSVTFIQPTKLGRGGDLTQWWQYVKGANWREPEGPGSSIKGKENHPVVHVAYEDALAYAKWKGHELPTEAQWEYAARGGIEIGEDWSQAFDKDGKPIANSWQGIFPVYNTEAGRLCRHRAGRLLSAERLRALRHDRQCLGADQRLVRAEPQPRGGAQSERAVIARCPRRRRTVAV